MATGGLGSSWRNETLNPVSSSQKYGLVPFKGTLDKLFGFHQPKENTLTGITNQYGIDTGSPTYAGDTYAALTRDQWQTYVSTFAPIENQLIDFAIDKRKPLEAMAEASADVNAAFDAQAGATDRRLKGLGVTLNADEQMARDRSFGLSKSLADVGSQNIAGQLTRDRQSAILGNPVPQSSTQALAAGG